MNGHLHQARKNKKDEFYTRYEDIEKELSNYKDQLKGLIVYCPCDDYRWSNFVKFFKDNFWEYGLRGLIATNFDIGYGAWKYEYNGKKETITQLNGDGDFRSEECTALRDEADIVITNPPFSLYRQFVKWSGYDFLIICPKLSVSYNEPFMLLKDGKARIGYEKPDFDGFSGGSRWFTTLTVDKPKFTTTGTACTVYDNYDAINVDKVKDIPDTDYPIGVPITVFDYDLTDYDIIGVLKGEFSRIDEYIVGHQGKVNGKDVFTRIILQKKLL